MRTPPAVAEPIAPSESAVRSLRSAKPSARAQDRTDVGKSSTVVLLTRSGGVSASARRPVGPARPPPGTIPADGTGTLQWGAGLTARRPLPGRGHQVVRMDARAAR